MSDIEVLLPEGATEESELRLVRCRKCQRAYQLYLQDVLENDLLKCWLCPAQAKAGDD